MNKKYLVPGMMGMMCLPMLQACNSTDAPDPVVDIGTDMTESQKGVIAIDPHKCIGCGRCTRVAPTNFAMDGITRKAVVISQDYDESVNRAIEICPVSAITRS